MTDLCRLGAKFNTDKVVGGYTQFYHTLFENRRDFRKVMEIGIGTPAAMVHVPDYKPGASLFMWRDYFEQATIYGLDVEPSVLINESRIQSLQCDQRSTQSLTNAAEWAGNDFDLILDDGSHEAEFQWNTFNHFIPLVRPGGFYIVEDAADSSYLSAKLTERCYPHSIVFAVLGNLTGKLIMVRA